MPDTHCFDAALGVYQRRLRLASMASAFVVAAASASLLTVALSLARVPIMQVRAIGVLGFAVTASLLGAYWWKQWTLARVAAAIEGRWRGLDNLVVTAEEAVTRRGIHPIVRDLLFREANVRLQALPPAVAVPLVPSFALAWGAVSAAFAVLLAVPLMPEPSPMQTDAGVGTVDVQLAPGDLHVIITPPSYTGTSARATLNPTSISALEGSRIRLEARREGGRIQLAEAGRDPEPFAFVGDRWRYEFRAVQSRVLLIQRPDSSGREDSDRLLQLRVEPDRRPLVRIRAPAKDLIFGRATGQVPVEIEARDDLALSSLVLWYTRVTGSGETFTFEEGEAPVRIQATAAFAWQGRATLTLEALKLAEGDTLVYRAVATDRKPGGDPSVSDTFLIEIGRMAGAASTGFALPEERDRQAISQQIVIIKTERLHADRATLTQSAFEEQSRLLAVEQRMVKAEFVFMTGGDVADEVEEAEHAHELAEGRFENTAQVELLRAIREMSRAEARLNAADTVQALNFEKNALRALQRAFDRRRYLLRSLPERTRIDTTRRLTGDRAGARPFPRAAVEAPRDEPVAIARQVMRELGVAVATREGLNAVLASRVLSVDPLSEPLQKTVASLASARDFNVRLEAAREAQGHLAHLVRARLAASPRGRISSDPLLGRFADEAEGRRVPPGETKVPPATQGSR